MASSGFLLIADISGYTAFLNESELEHAQEILTELLNLLLDHTRAPLVVSRTAGDAVISYALGDPFRVPQSFVEHLEATYGHFRDAIDRLVLNNRCTCAACVNVASLDLKFFVHYGAFGVQQLGAHDELVGNDVNLLHRLLKNHVVERTGLAAYALYTEAALARLGLSEWAATLTPHTEHYEHIGEVAVRVQDLAPIAAKARAARERSVDDVVAEVSVVIDATPAQVWDALNDAELRAIVIGTDRIVRKPTQDRMDERSEFLCYHGERLTVQEVVVWDPFRRMITRDHVRVALARFVATSEWLLEPVDGGTQVVHRVGRPEGTAYSRFVAAVILKTFFVSGLTRSLEAFRDVVEASTPR